jgi:putative effector of murein hydrolase
MHGRVWQVSAVLQRSLRNSESGKFLMLAATGIEYDDYKQGADLLSYLLTVVGASVFAQLY